MNKKRIYCVGDVYFKSPKGQRRRIISIRQSFSLGMASGQSVSSDTGRWTEITWINENTSNHGKSNIMTWNKWMIGARKLPTRAKNEDNA